MRTTTRRVLAGHGRAALAAAILLTVCPRFMPGATLDTYIGPDNGLWTEAGNWSLGVAPNSSAYDVLINSMMPVTVQLDANETINNLAVYASNTLSAMQSLTVASASIVNHGTIWLAGDYARLKFQMDTILSGGGSILLAGSSNGIDSTATMRLVTNNLIYGQGDIGGASLKVVNMGEVRATTGVLTLHAYNNTTVTDSFVNLGTAAAADGGTLGLGAGYYNNAGGVIEARANATVAVSAGAIINGGWLRGTGGGTVVLQGGGVPVKLAGTYLGGLVQTGTSGGVTLTGHLSNSGTLSVAGGAVNFGVGSGPTIVDNSGVIQMAPGANIWLAYDLNLAGTGSLTLDANNCTGSTTNNLPARLTNGILISGRGTLGSTGTSIFVTNTGTISATTGVLSIIVSNFTNYQNYLNTINKGVMRADGGTLALSGSSSAFGYDNNGGTIEALANSVVAITSTTISGGTIRTTGGGTVTTSNAILKGIAFGGGLVLTADSTSGMILTGALSNASPLTLAGSLTFGASLTDPPTTLTNTGLIQMGRTDGGPATILSIMSDTVFMGGGTIVLQGSGFKPLVSSSIAMRLSNNNLISGWGTLGSGGSNGMLLTNSGTITATGGVLTLVGSTISGVSALSAPANFNTGILRADGGTLTILGQVGNTLSLTNTNGVIEALANSVVTINSMAAVNGGVIRAWPGGSVTLTGTSIANVSLEGVIQASQTVTVGGMITNQGQLVGVITYLNIALNTDSTFTGAGTIQLNGGNIGYTYPVSSPTRFTNQSHITGFGAVGVYGSSNYLYTTNTGTITATGGLLTIYSGSYYNPYQANQKNYNMGLLQANGGTLNIWNQSSASVYNGLDNTGGIIEALPNSVVNLSGGTVTGGVVRAQAGGTVTLTNVVVSNVNLSGLIQAGAASSTAAFTGSIFNAGTLAMGTCTLGSGSPFYSQPPVSLVNAGIIQVVQNINGLNALLTIAADTFLGGGGTVVLNRAVLGSAYVTSFSTRLTTDNLIIGNGTLGATNYGYGGLFTNTGTITATGGTLTILSQSLSPTWAFSNYNYGRMRADGGTLFFSGQAGGYLTLDNTKGIIEATASSIVSITNLPVQGGVIRALAGGTLTLSGGTLTNTTWQGLTQVTGLSWLNGVTNIKENVTLTGSGTLSMGTNVPGNLSVLVNQATLQLNGPVINLNGDWLLTGGGSITLTGNNVWSSSLGTFRLTSDNYWSGRGTIGSSATKITNAGTICASTGTININSTSASDAIINTGTMRADAGMLVFSGGTLTNSGLIEACNYGRVSLKCQVNGGILSLSSQGVLGLDAANVLGGGCTVVFHGGSMKYSVLNSSDYSAQLSSAPGQAYAIDTNGQTVSYNTPLVSIGGSLNKLGSGVLILTGANGYDGGTTISAGTLQVGNGGTTGSLGAGVVINNSELQMKRADAWVVANTIIGAGTVTQVGAGTTTLSNYAGTGPLNISAGKLAFAPTTVANTNTIVTPSLTLSGATNAWTSTLDIGNSALIVQAPTTGGGAAAQAQAWTVANQIASGLDVNNPDGILFGGTGITSSTAANYFNTTGNPLYAVGWLQNNTLGMTVGDGTSNTTAADGAEALYPDYGPFAGDNPSIGLNDVLVKYTYWGDADLNGIIDDTDVALLVNGYQLGLSGWVNGDFDYNGVVDDTDVAILINAYQFQGAPLTVRLTVLPSGGSVGGVVDVPEAGTVGVLGLGVVGMWRRRGRRHGK